MTDIYLTLCRGLRLERLALFDARLR